MVFWALWAAILTSLPIIYVILGQSSTQSPNQASGFPLGLIAALPPLVISVVVRWAILPRIENATKALSIFVMGMALAEGCGMIGIILGGAHKNLLFIAGIVGVLQYAPIFASRFGQESTAPPHTKVVK
jgi:hypothetical protein